MCTDCAHFTGRADVTALSSKNIAQKVQAGVTNLRLKQNTSIYLAER